MKTIRSLVAAAATTTMMAAPAFGAGFAVNEHSAKATGRGGAVVATVDDPSAIFYNPAGLTNVKGTAIQLGASIIFPNAEYVGPGWATQEPADPSQFQCDAAGPGEVCQDTVSTPVPVPNFYAAHALSDKAYVGLGVYLPYGLGLKWDNQEQFVGRTTLQEQSLRTFFITPTIALKLSDEVSVAVSVSLVPATVYLKRSLGATDNHQLLFPASQFGTEGTVELSGSAFGVGANAGVQVTLLENLKLGLGFRSAVGLDFKGDAKFNLPEGLPPTIAANFPDGPVNAEVTLPHSFALGIGWVDEDFSVEVAGNLTLWQSLDELRFNFETGKPAATSASARDWKMAPTFRLGGEYTVVKFEDLGSLSVRLGIGYDMTPTLDETVDLSLPDADRVLPAGGFGLELGPVHVDLSYLAVYVFGRELPRSVNFPGGKLPGRTIHLAAVTVGAEF